MLAFLIQMNLILLNESDFISASRVRFDRSSASGGSDRRYEHLKTVLRVSQGSQLRVGLIGSKMGQGLVENITENQIELSCRLDTDPPPPLPIDLYMALPRPKYVARIIQAATSLGVKNLFFFNSYRVDKIYWSCRQLEESEIREASLLGLEQARDTILPKIHLRRLFKPFVEDELPSLINGRLALVAHPSALESCPYDVSQPVSLVIGPEGGFIDYEIKMLDHAGIKPVRTLERILKVETAMISLIGRLM